METTLPTSTPRRRSSRGFPLFRTIIIIAIVGGIIIGAGALSFFADQASRQVPLSVDPFPGAVFWGERDVTDSTRTQFYKVPGVEPQTVADYYQQELNEHTGGTEEECVHIQVSDPGALRPGEVPYFYKCLFDRSYLSSSQFTEIIIMPGQYNADPEFNTEGMTVVQYNQTWQP